MNDTMHVAAIRAHGGLEQIRIETWPVPEPGPDEALVAVRACGLNYLDVFVLQGMPGLPVAMPRIGGGDVAGEVVAVGENVDDGWIGGRVVLFPLLPQGGVLGENANGGLCEYLAVDQSQLMKLPDDVPFTDAAAIPIAYGTAHRMLVTKGKLSAGETVMILGASGGVGTACVQIACARGAEVIAVTSSSAKAARLTELGAHHVIDVTQEDFSRRAWEITGRKGVDVVVNYAGGDTWTPCIRAMARDGRILTCGATAGFETAIDMRYVWVRELTVIGSRGYRKEDIDRMIEDVRAGVIRPVIDRVLPLEETAAGVGLLADREVFGKVIITP